MTSSAAPQASRPPPAQPRRGWFRAGGWYLVLTVATLGLFAWVPFVHAGSRLNNSVLKRRAMIFGGLAVLLAVLISITPTNADGDPVGAAGNALNTVSVLLAFAVTIVAVIQQWPLRQTVYTAAQAYASTSASDPAVTNVLAARQRRERARALATDDPLMARELRIGRPDLARTYDDGGLVDLNTAPAATIAQICELDPTAAEAMSEAIVTARGNGFTSIDEIFMLTDIPVADWDMLRDRAIILVRSTG